MAIQQEVIDAVGKMTREECHSVWKLINARVSQLAAIETQKFHVGQRVYFIHSKTNRRIEGVVKSVNQKTISINTKEGTWKVSPTFLSPLE
jgi:hypothetical protein